MGYAKVDTTLEENGVALDILSDGTLFVKIRSSRSKPVERERTKQQQPYRNILMAGRQLPPGVSQEIGRNVIANAIIIGFAGELPTGEHVGKIEDGKPVEFATLTTDETVAILRDYPDFAEDVSAASSTNATFEAAKKIVDAEGEPAPGDAEASEAAAGN